MLNGAWIVNVVIADPPAARLTGLVLNEVSRNDEEDRVMLPEKLSILDNDTVDCPEPPWGIESTLGFVEMLKSGPVILISM